MGRIMAVLLCVSMVLSGCTGTNEEIVEEFFDNLGCTDVNAVNYDENATVNDEMRK